MPNWCKTKYVITGSKEDVSNLNSIFQKVLSMKDNKSGDFNNNWLGFVISELDGDNKEISCRGWFEDVKLKNRTTLRLTTYSAWCPCFELFEFIVQKYPSLQYYFIAEEPAMDVYITNDAEKRYFKFGKKYDVYNKDAIKDNIKILKSFTGMANNQVYVHVS